MTGSHVTHEHACVEVCGLTGVCIELGAKRSARQLQPVSRDVQVPAASPAGWNVQHQLVSEAGVVKAALWTCRACRVTWLYPVLPQNPKPERKPRDGGVLAD